MKASRRFEFDIPGGTASFRGRVKPTPEFCYAMQLLAAAAMSHIAIEGRSCDPRVGDRLIGRDQISVLMEVKEILSGQGVDASVKYTLTGSSKEFTDPLKAYQWMVQSAIQAGETFHAMEDDEE